MTRHGFSWATISNDVITTGCTEHWLLDLEWGHYSEESLNSIQWAFLRWQLRRWERATTLKMTYLLHMPLSPCRVCRSIFLFVVETSVDQMFGAAALSILAPEAAWKGDIRVGETKNWETEGKCGNEDCTYDRSCSPHMFASLSFRLSLILQECGATNTCATPNP